MPHLALKVPPLLLWTSFALVALAIPLILPNARFAFPGYRFVAALGLVIGTTIVLIAGIQFRRAKTTVSPLSPHRSKTLVVSGIYRVSRNPMYLGMAIALAGVAVWSATLVGYLLVPAFCLYITELQIKPEERVLLDVFGEQFATYMAVVRRWL